MKLLFEAVLPLAALCGSFLFMMGTFSSPSGSLLQWIFVLLTCLGFAYFLGSMAYFASPQRRE